MAALTYDNVTVSFHGRRAGLVGDGISAPSGFYADGNFFGSSRGVTLPLIGTTTGVAAAVTLTGAAVGDKVISVLDLTAGTNLSADFETTISVANQIQQTAAGGSNNDKMLVTLQPQS